VGEGRHGDTYEIVRRESFAILHFAWLPNPNILHVPHERLLGRAARWHSAS
jgi:hypothetical protein